MPCVPRFAGVVELCTLPFVSFRSCLLSPVNPLSLFCEARCVSFPPRQLYTLCIPCQRKNAIFINNEVRTERENVR